MKCATCNLEKDEKDFPKKKKEICLKCVKFQWYKKYSSSEKGRARSKKYFLKNQGSGYQNEWYRNNPEARKKSAERCKIYCKNFPEKKRERERKYQIKNREKTRIRVNLNYAIRKGKILKPNICESCNLPSIRIQAHHHDYSKPFDVKWLCVECHKIEHGKIL